MKLPSLWAEATVKMPFVLFAMIAIAMIWASDVLAYEDYASGCDNCHGDFTADPYNPPSGGASWSDSLHIIHRDNMLGGDCDTCHTTGGRKPVLLESSNGGDGLAAISCVGCHGRDADDGNATVTGTSQRGAGLRQHHVGVASCTGCHDDQTGYTPVGENILPNYYANPGTGHPNIPSSSCNGENFSGSPTGLDNDGDGVYDTADSDCLIPVELMIFEIE
jgi:hypothetical protein